jgi:hypothetical protein
MVDHHDDPHAQQQQLGSALLAALWSRQAFDPSVELVAQDHKPPKPYRGQLSAARTWIAPEDPTNRLQGMEVLFRHRIACGESAVRSPGLHHQPGVPAQERVSPGHRMLAGAVQPEDILGVQPQILNQALKVGDGVVTTAERGRQPWIATAYAAKRHRVHCNTGRKGG